jgi:hypothetical protein
MSFPYSFAFLVLMLFGGKTYSQNEMDIPVLELEAPCLNLNRIIARDSILNKVTSIEVFAIDHKDFCVPADYTVRLMQYEPVPYYLLAFSHYGEKVPYDVTYRVPDTCLYYQSTENMGVTDY